MTRLPSSPLIRMPSSPTLADDRHWYKDAIIYELHVRAFKDSNGDGIGDFAGLIESLDYLVDLGVTAVWLLPFYPSPLRDGGYDIADYTDIHEHYGTREDFARLLAEAHRRGLRVITELVLNHTSAEHPWFQRARRAPPGSRERDFYVWSDTPKRYEHARIIFQDFESSNWSWDPVANAYYWHRFYAHQPDLNFESPDVRAALFDVLDYWFDLGVDGLRLDAVPYLFEREGTSCENLPETHEFLRELRRHIDGKYRNRLLLAEANQWPTDAAAYFGDGDECHMNFHFPLMPRMFMAIEEEDSFPIVNILKRTPRIPESCQWATFLRNHDELTLEMVTDEDRDSMYRAYAAERHARVNLGIRRRLGPLLNVRRKVELMNALLLSLPGTPVIYYGDEIGMGDNIYLGDRDGVRTPMQWSSDRNAGFSRANPQRLYLPPIIDPEFHYESINVEAQQANASSLLWWMKRLIAKRKEYRTFGRGSIEFIPGDNPRVLAFVREHEGEQVLVVANLSRFVQCARLGLHAWKGATPVELFGRMRFPEVTDAPYFVSLGPHSFYWLALHQPDREQLAGGVRPALACRESWTGVLAANRRVELANVLLPYVKQQRWFRGKARTVKHAAVTEVIPTGANAAVVLLFVDYEQGHAEVYSVPVAFVSDAANDGTIPAGSAIGTVTISDVPGGGELPLTGTLYDGVCVEAFAATLLDTMVETKRLPGEHGELRGAAFESLREAATGANLTPRVFLAEQSNTTLIFGNRFMLKLFRVIADGPSTELELGRHLAAKNYGGVARLAGALEYRVALREPGTIGVLFDFVPNQGDAWQLTLDSLDRYFDLLLATEQRPEPPGPPDRPLLERTRERASEQVIDWVGPYLDRVRLLGVRTAELHQVLAGDPGDPLFAPQPFELLYQQSLHQSASAMMARTFEVLRGRRDGLAPDTRVLADELLAREADVDRALARIARRKIPAVRIRAHGDYHLGQVLWTGNDFVIIDFEGEPARPLTQRRFRRCPVRDAAAMLRSFHYASQAALRDGRVRPEDVAVLAPWGRAWVEWVSAAFLAGYLDTMRGSPLIPSDPADLAGLIEFYLLEKCIYELGYELDNRPDWLEIPMRGLLALSGAPA
jgi:maltose alpha-D-glucosyltransferase/alpha-amylase